MSGRHLWSSNVALGRFQPTVQRPGTTPSAVQVPAGTYPGTRVPGTPVLLLLLVLSWNMNMHKHTNLVCFQPFARLLCSTFPPFRQIHGQTPFSANLTSETKKLRQAPAASSSLLPLPWLSAGFPLTPIPGPGATTVNIFLCPSTLSLGQFVTLSRPFCVVDFSQRARRHRFFF